MSLGVGTEIEGSGELSGDSSRVDIVNTGGEKSERLGVSVEGV